VAATGSRLLRHFGVGAVAVGLAALLFIFAVILSWEAYTLSGCPPLFEDGPCRSGWESEASSVLEVISNVVVYGGPLLALVGVPMVAARRRRRLG
jgi:hypothetical protein